MNKVERRFNTLAIEVRKGEKQEATKLKGYGAVFNERSEDLGGFREVIAEGAFDSVIDHDVRALWNHDDNIVLGRTASGTLKLSIDERGLKYEVDLPDTQTVRDLVVAPMERGDVSASSFGFIVDEDEWDKDKDGNITRTIRSVSGLLDVSPVTYPAYPDTSAALRSMTSALGSEQELENKDMTDPNEFQKRAIKLLGLEDETLTTEQIVERCLDAIEERDTKIAGFERSEAIHRRFQTVA